MPDAYDLQEVLMRYSGARRTLRGCLELVVLVENEGASFQQVAAAFRCSVSTAFEWVIRWRHTS